MNATVKASVFVAAIALGVARGFYGVSAPNTPTTQIADGDNHEPVSAQPPVANNAPDVVTRGPSTTPSAGDATSVTLQRSDNGHFYADVMINGTAVHALVDTGATSVAFSREDAARVGIVPNPSDFSGIAQTANGVTRFARVTLSSVSLGPLTRSDIPAAVMTGNSGETLLGMTFLSKFKVKIEGDTMVLS
jgi:clan AA aspartic protease (TIGR02281 family)